MQVNEPSTKNDINCNSESLTMSTLVCESLTSLGSFGKCLRINPLTTILPYFVRHRKSRIVLIPILLADFPRPFCFGWCTRGDAGQHWSAGTCLFHLGIWWKPLLVLGVQDREQWTFHPSKWENWTKGIKIAKVKFVMTLDLSKLKERVYIQQMWSWNYAQKNWVL